MINYNFEEEKECIDFFKGNLTKQELNQAKIYNVRNNVYLLIKPFTSQFFYWTLLLLILHHFNFKKSIIKIIISHYILRTIGDMLDSYASRYTDYYHKVNGICVKEPVTKVEHHPLRWFISRQLAGIFWYSGEIVADWYPLLRTKAIADNQKDVWYIYLTCFIFNLSKITMIFYHFTVDKMEIREKEDYFYSIFWAIYLVSLCCSLLYDSSVYIAMRRAILKDTANINFGFLKKFRNISEYRILVSAIIGLIGIPIMGTSAILRLKYSDYDWSFEDLRIFFVNTSYYMMFIDQLMLYSITNEENSLFSSKNSKLFII
jgi:hypothetical protein